MRTKMSLTREQKKDLQQLSHYFEKVEKLAAKNNRITKLLETNRSDEAIVEEVYLSALSRHPTGAEKDKILKALDLKDQSERRTIIEDVYWAVLSSKEFLFNH